MPTPFHLRSLRLHLLADHDLLLGRRDFRSSDEPFPNDLDVLLERVSASHAQLVKDAEEWYNTKISLSSGLNVTILLLEGLDAWLMTALVADTTSLLQERDSEQLREKIREIVALRETPARFLGAVRLSMPAALQERSPREVLADLDRRRAADNLREIMEEWPKD
jgi:hypothetical protein